MRLKSNICLCYHGFVADGETPYLFRMTDAQFMAHIAFVQGLGYDFVLPSVYADWYRSRYVQVKPVASIIFDDGLDSLDLVVPWLITQNIPFGIALVTARQKLREPETDFVAWETLSEWVDSGLCEILAHTHNLHNILLAKPGADVEPGAPLGGSLWTDNGEILYLKDGDTRHYWDYSIVEKATWGFPLAGCDADDGYTTPITSQFHFKARHTFTCTGLRLWACLHKPTNFEGYDVNVKISIDDGGGFDEVADTIIYPRDYGTRTQWIEREFQTVLFDTPYSIVADQEYTVKFETQNQGDGLFCVFGLPTFDADDWSKTSCLSLLPPGSFTDDWEGIGYEADSQWPGLPAIILIDGTGSVMSEADWQAYIKDDLVTARNRVGRYLQAVWTRRDNGYLEERASLELDVLYGTYNDGSVVDKTFLYYPEQSFTAETMAVKAGRHCTCPTDGGALTCSGAWGHWGCVVDVHVHKQGESTWTTILRFAPNWTAWHWFEHALDTAYTFQGGQTYEIRFETKDASPWSTKGLMTVYWDQVESRAFIDFYSAQKSNAARPRGIAYPFGDYNALDNPIWLAPEDISAALTEVFGEIGITHGFTIWPARNEKERFFREPDTRNTIYTLSRLMAYGTLTDQVLFDQTRVYAGVYYDEVVNNRQIVWQTVQESDPLGNAATKYHRDLLNYIGFDAYYFACNGVIRPGILNDGGYYLDISGRTGDFIEGETVTESVSGAAGTVIWATNYAYGDVLKLSDLSGTWSGGQTVTGGGSGATATGDAAGPVEYYDDRTYLRNKSSAKQLLVFSNYDPEPFYFGGSGANCRGSSGDLLTGEPNPHIAAYVLEHPDEYLSQIVGLVADGDWDGCIINLEWVPEAQEANAEAFFEDLQIALAAVGKELHINVPAVTGTAYDNPDWCGWCDYNALLEFADYIKIMSYTESGAFSAAAPHAPDSFWELVYDYVAVNVDAGKLPKILAGCNAFADIWYNGGDTLYTSYSDGVANGLLLGAEFSKDNSEGYWEKSGQAESYFGVGDTVNRAIAKVVEMGLGGVALWNADLSNVIDHYPQHLNVLLWWRDFSAKEEDEEYVKDWSGWENHGSLFGSAAFEDLAGKGKVIDLDDDGSYVHTPVDNDHFAGLTEFTLETWLYAESPHSCGLIDKNSAFRLYLNSGVPGLSFYDGAGWTSVDGSAAINYSAWNHVAGVFDGADLVLYLNGIEIGREAATGSTPDVESGITVGGDSPLGIGAAPIGTSPIGWGLPDADTQFYGKVAEVFIKDTSSTQAEVREDMLRWLWREHLDVLELVEVWTPYQDDPLTFCTGCQSLEITSYDHYGETVTYTYTPLGFDRGGVKREMLGSQTQTTITLAAGDSLQELLRDYDIRGYTIGLKMTFRSLDHTDPNNTASIFLGQIMFWSLANSVLEVVAREHTLDLGGSVPPAQFDYFCRHFFKRNRCRYAGAAATCNKTETQCQVYGNQDYFGGFKFVPRLMRRKGI